MNENKRWTNRKTHYSVVNNTQRSCVKMPIRYTPGQFRDALGLTKETFRYWKRDLPALAGVVGHSPYFSAGDLLATAICKLVTEKAGVPVSRLAPFATELYAHCREASWPQLERLAAVFNFSANSVYFTKSPNVTEWREVIVFVPLRPLIDQLRQHLLVGTEGVQPGLALPPVSMSAGVRK